MNDVYTLKDYIYFAMLCVVGGFVFYVAGTIGLEMR